jgi:hypothetical protein
MSDYQIIKIHKDLKLIIGLISKLNEGWSMIASRSSENIELDVILKELHIDYTTNFNTEIINRTMIFIDSKDPPLLEKYENVLIHCESCPHHTLTEQNWYIINWSVIILGFLITLYNYISR